MYVSVFNVIALWFSLTVGVKSYMLNGFDAKTAAALYMAQHHPDQLIRQNKKTLTYTSKLVLFSAVRTLAHHHAQNKGQTFVECLRSFDEFSCFFYFLHDL